MKHIANRRVLIAAIALSAAGILRATDKGPDSASYTATNNTVYSFIDLVGGGGSASVLSGTDDGVALLTLPFPFQYYGKSFTLVCASANGLISFVSSAGACAPSVDFANTDLTTTAPPGDLPTVMPFWTDLSFQVPGGGALYYQTQGPLGSRKFVLEWSNAFPQSSSNPITFEVILYEGSNKILFQYQTVDLGSGDPNSNGALATVGVRDSGGNTNQRQIAWSFNAGVLANSSAILFTPPPSGQTSVNTITSSPPGLTISIDGTPYVTPKVVSWTPNTTHTLLVTSPQINGGTRNTLTTWTTGVNPPPATPQITVTAPSPGTAFTANFNTEYQLTTLANPAAGGTVTGAGWYAGGTQATVQATAAANYAFVQFSGDLKGATNPQNLTMNSPKSVAANFQASANPTLTAAVSGKADTTPAGRRIWTIRLSNTGLGTANSAQLTGITLSQTAGTPCSPAAALISTFPITIGTIAPSTNATGSVTIDFSGCTDTAARFSAVVKFAANNGAYTGSTTISNQTK